MNAETVDHLPRGWKLTVSISCGGCGTIETAENASLPRIKNALRGEGWRYDVDANDWKCRGCRERLGF